MAMEPGGRADKLGNEYERLWVVRQVLQVLTGEAVAVTWEPAGHDSVGVDVLVDLPNEVRSLESCKRENGSEGKWKLSHLHSRGVLEAAGQHLNSQPGNRFAFVSRDPCPELRDLSERADHHDHATTFYSGLSAALRTAFHQLGAYRSLSPSDDDQDKDLLFAELQACRAELHDEAQLADWVRLSCRHLIDGDPDTVRALLGDFAAQRLGTRMDRQCIVEFLASKGLALRDSGDHQSVTNAIARLQQSFLDSISPYLINGQLIQRSETTKLIEAVTSDRTDRPRLIMVHGKAGFGKSGVLYEFAGALAGSGIPFLPLRLDRNVPTGSADQYGREKCELQMSPARALKSIAGNDRSVLILDQLDALRWTAAHTDQPMDVLTEIVRDALNSLLQADITVVLVCRTFDLQDDPRIAHLKSMAKSIELEVGLLTADAVREVINGEQDVWSSLSDSQQLLLRQPQALHLWTVLRQAAQTSPVFRTHTDLMRAFWEDLHRRERPSSIAREAVENVLGQLVEHMDRTGRLTAPASITDEGDGSVLDFLQSAGVIRMDQRRQCVFTHQSYFDYLVAADLNRRILRGETTLTAWIRNTDQSLFRREQLRQVLALQRDDDPTAYIAAVQQIIADPDIRFHLKHLIIRLLAQADPPTEPEADLVTSLMDDPDWRDQVYGQVAWNRPPWFLALDERGVWRRWIDSADEEVVERSLRMLGFMTRHFGPRIAPVLSEVAGRGPKWAAKVAQCLAYGDLEDETDEVFELRLDLARRGHGSAGRVWWERLAKTKPNRAVRLFDLHVRLFVRAGQALRQGKAKELQGTGIESHGRDEIKWQCRAAARRPVTVWKRIAPMCIRLERLRHWAQHHHDWMDFQSPNSQLADQSRDMLKTCEQMLVAAGRSLARRRPDQFRRLVAHWDGRRRTSLIERAILRSMAAISEADADYAAHWVLAKPRRLRIDDRFESASTQEATRRTLAHIAPHCSDETIRRVESAILNYHDPHLKRIAVSQHKDYDPRGYLHPNRHGRANYILLSAIPPERLSDQARGQLGVWSRKFGAPPVGRGVRSPGGFVGSTIPSSRLQYLSDNDWMNLATGDWSERNRGGFRRKVMGKNSLGEASHEHFANDMGAMARRQPSRFARLILNLPADASPNYIRQVLRAFDQKDPPDVLVKAREQNKENPAHAETLERELGEWKPATVDEIEAIIERIGFPNDAETAKAICWLVDKREDISWSEATVDLIAAMAKNHPDPASGEFASGHYDPTDHKTIIPDVANSGLNCVRGVAALAIKSLLFADHGLYSKLQEAIEALSRDSNVAVRTSAVAVCVPILNIDRDAAIAHFLVICETEDERVFQSHHIDWFLRYAFWSHHEQLIPVVERMVRSGNDEVAKRGAAWATAAWVYRGWCEELIGRCRSGSQAHRHGVAEVAGQSPWDAESVDARMELLPALFDDEDRDVRHDSARVFWKDEPWGDDRVAGLAMQFIKSRAFAEDPTPVIHGLAEVKGSIVFRAQVVFGIADAFAGHLADAARDMSKGIASDVPEVFKLLLRLYQQAQDTANRELQAACLDRWDSLLQAGVGGYRDAESLLDATEV